jgi:hypothetical protein
MKVTKWIIVIALLVIAVPGAKYLYSIIKHYPQAIRQSKETFSCSYFANLEIGTDIKTIEKDFSLPAPHNTLMGNFFYIDRIFEYVVPSRVIRVGLTSTEKDSFLFNGDYEIRFVTDSCSHWTQRPVPQHTIEQLNENGKQGCMKAKSYFLPLTLLIFSCALHVPEKYWYSSEIKEEHGGHFKSDSDIPFVILENVAIIESIHFPDSLF